MEKNKIELAALLEIYKEEGVNPKLDLNRFQADYKRLENNKTSILIQVLIFIGALLTAAFFFGFLGVIGLFDSSGAMLVIGLVITFISLAVPYLSNQSNTIEPFAMALMIVGTSLFSAGFLGSFFNFLPFLWASLAVSFLIAIVAGSHLQKFAAIVCFNLCAYWIIWNLRIQIAFNFLILLNAAILTIGWLKEATVLTAYPRLGQWYSAILNGCAISMIGLLLGSANLSKYYYRYEEEVVGGSYWWVSALLLITLVLWALSETLDLIGERAKKIPILIGTGLALLLLIKAPGIVGGILLLFLGVYAGYHLLVGQGVLAIFFFTVLFYYNMNTTLLFKSVLMVSAGLLFLALGAAIKRVYDKHNVELSKDENESL
jgi:hypothetical protein